MIPWVSTSNVGACVKLLLHHRDLLIAAKDVWNKRISSISDISYKFSPGQPIPEWRAWTGSKRLGGWGWSRICNPSNLVQPHEFPSFTIFMWLNLVSLPSPGCALCQSAESSVLQDSWQTLYPRQLCWQERLDWVSKSLKSFTFSSPASKVRMTISATLQRKSMWHHRCYRCFLASLLIMDLEDSAARKRKRTLVESPSDTIMFLRK